jgi:hypothetical protein
MDRIRFGTAYYAEYQHRPDLEADFELMVKAGFSVIRVGESVWSTWEPEDGRFELDWLRAYHEIARIGQELREAGGAFATAEPDYDIAVLYDSDSKFALSTQGPRFRSRSGRWR